MKKLFFFVACLVVVGINLTQAQTVRITGVVTSSEDGKSIPGVSVVVKGTTTGGVTNIDGKYEINVPSAAQTLVFSFIGMKTQEVEIGGRAIINVTLETESLQVEEVVVTALGISRQKKSLGYSVQDVKGEDLTKSNNPDLITTLSGKVAGLEVRQTSGMPGAPAQIFIRGARSFSGNNAPLYVVDGMPIVSGNDYTQGNGGVVGSGYSNRALDIDPSDIESLNVLKGQAAAALYGMRASNGVIVITTKSGKNAQKGKPTITFSSGFTVDRIDRLPDLQQTYAQGTNFTYTPVSSFSYGPKMIDLPDDPTYGGNAQGHPGKYFNAQKNAWVDPTPTNSAKNFFDNSGTTWNNSINLSQAGQFGFFSLGFGSSNQKGTIPGTFMDRYTAKMSATVNISDKWKTGFTGNYSDSKLGKLPSGNDSWLFTVFGCPPSFDLMGTPYHVPSGKDATWRQISYRRGTVGENPLWGINNNHFLEATKRFFGNAYTEYKIMPWLTAKYQIGLDTYNSGFEDLWMIGDAKTGQAFPTSGQYPTPSNPNYAYVAPTGGRIDNYGITRRNINSLATVSADFSIIGDLKGNVLIGNEIVDNQLNNYFEQGTGFSIPGWANISNATTYNATKTRGWNRTFGLFTNLSLDYKNMLFLNATGRNDFVSTMPRGSRSFFYPSTSLGFLFTELTPLKNNKILSFGKIRLSYAEVGQAGIYNELIYVTGGANSGFTTDGIGYPIGGISAYVPNQRIYDPNLKPQNTQTMEYGVELKFLNNRFGVDYTYINTTSVDQIFAVPLAGSTGYTDLVMNAGKMTGKGHEVVVYLTPVKTNNLEWNVQANFTKYINKCVSLAAGVDNISLGGFTDPNVRASAGSTYPAIYGTMFQKDAQGRILVDEDPASPSYGMPMAGDFGKIGDVSPNFILSGNTSLKYKFVSVSASLEWKSGGQMYSGSNRLIDLYGTSANTIDRDVPFIYPGYKADGSKNDIARGGPSDVLGQRNALEYMQSNIISAVSESAIVETSYLKLRDVSLTIDLPSKWIKSILIKNASVSLTARNFLLWTPMKNFDPESSQGQGNMSGGMDYMSLPQSHYYGFAINLTF